MKRRFAAAEWEAVEAEIQSATKILEMFHGAPPEEAEFLVSLAERKNQSIGSKMRHAELVEAIQAANHFGQDLIQWRGLLAYAQSEGKLTAAQDQLLAFIKTSPPVPTEDLTCPGAQAFYTWHRDNKKEFIRRAQEI